MYCSNGTTDIYPVKKPIPKKKQASSSTVASVGAVQESVSSQLSLNRAIGLALIPADIVESTWVDIIDLHTPDYAGAVT
ncbi:unnamed protein product, partial [Didymodactylos carnosus]